MKWNVVWIFLLMSSLNRLDNSKFLVNMLDREKDYAESEAKKTKERSAKISKSSKDVKGEVKKTTSETSSSVCILLSKFNKNVA